MDTNRNNYHRHYGHKSKYNVIIIKIFDTNRNNDYRNFEQKIVIFAKNRNPGKKFGILTKNLNVGQKLKFRRKIEIFVKVKISLLDQKMTNFAPNYFKL